MNRSKKKNLRILITAGPTRERIDPVRYISNYSTGTFGYAFAREAAKRGHKVLLVSGPVSLSVPSGCRVVDVESAEEMRREALRGAKEADCIIMAAAVSDWRAVNISRRKIKKCPGQRYLKLVENPDILKGLSSKKRPGQIIVGFALETENLEKNAIKKLLSKEADFIVANRHEGKRSAFGDIPTKVVLIDKYGNKTEWRRASKALLAKNILDRVLKYTI